RQIGELSRQVFSRISHDYHLWVTTLASRANIEILEPEDESREDLVRPYFQQLAKPAIAVILKCKEPERIAVTRTANGGYVDLKRRWVNLYYFYVKDPNCGRMSIRVCPYFPFNISVWLNGHEWLACRMKQEDLHL